PSAHLGGGRSRVQRHARADPPDREPHAQEARGAARGAAPARRVLDAPPPRIAARPSSSPRAAVGRAALARSRYTSRALGGMSGWLKETGCNPVGSAYAGSNPAPPPVLNARRTRAFVVSPPCVQSPDDATRAHRHRRVDLRPAPLGAAGGDRARPGRLR